MNQVTRRTSLVLFAALDLAVFGTAGCFSSTSAAPDGGDAGKGSEASFDAGSTNTEGGGASGGPTCVAPSGAGTQHTTSITAPETWTAAGSPHVVPYDLGVTAQVTLEPCATVLIGNDVTITFGPAGALVANGTASQPISIDAQDTTKPWASMRFIGGSGHLAHVTIDHGGAPGSTLSYYAATLDVRGDQTKAVQPVLFVDSVTIKDSKSQGIYMHDGAAFDPASTGLVVTGSAANPVHSWTSAVGTLPDGQYTGNASDAILVSAEGCSYEALTRGAETIHDRGVPYTVGYGANAVMCVAGGANGLATLTIDPGVTLEFAQGAHLAIEEFQGTNPASGALVVNGTAAKPVTFTSAQATPAAGDWLGIWFGEVPDATSKIDHAVVQYAGGTSVSGSGSCPYTNVAGAPNDAAIRIFGIPAASIVTNTLISDSASNGIDRGYRDDAKVPDFVGSGGNTFTNIAHCKQTYPSDASGACPAPASVPCP